ncbi:MAG: hypothetical protein GY947_21780, partial [Rhodobacteraceae bacterium]|nr:hypothetical protein [Paracoccaceae bacterium]
EELETPTGFVRVVAVDETQGLPDQWIIEILDRERRITSKTRVTSGMDVALEIDPIWDWENCVARLSKTGDFLLVKKDGELLVLDTSPDRIPANDPPPLRPGRVASAEFFAAGPSVITTDLSGKVTLWELSGTSGSSWTNRVIYSGSTELGYAQSDGKGSRLLLIEHPDGPMRRAIVHSRDANRTWRVIDERPRGLDAEFLADGSVLSNGRKGRITSWLHTFDEAVAAAKAELAPECRPAAPSDWRSSPCWPLGFE